MAFECNYTIQSMINLTVLKSVFFANYKQQGRAINRDPEPQAEFIWDSQSANYKVSKFQTYADPFEFQQCC